MRSPDTQDCTPSDPDPHWAPLSMGTPSSPRREGKAPFPDNTTLRISRYVLTRPPPTAPPLVALLHLTTVPINPVTQCPLLPCLPTFYSIPHPHSPGSVSPHPFGPESVSDLVDVVGEGYDVGLHEPVQKEKVLRV